ncbi:putative RNA-directed DNA polymerase [Helianthus annuus]|nr:putative RNA-directed DNA polymerase [Helianthus annuus]
MPKNVSKEVSYKEILTGDGGPPSSSTKTLVLEERAALYPDHCVMRSVIGEAKDGKALGGVKLMLRIGGYEECPVSYIGGLKVMVVLRDKRSALEFINRKDELWGGVLSSAMLWEGQAMVVERVAWLKVIGMPLQLRDSKNYDKVGELFGRVIWGSDFSWVEADNSCGRCGVMMSSMKRIEQEVQIHWEGNKYSVWVIEEEDRRFQGLIDELSTAEPCSPIKNVESIAGGGELEDGEIRMGDGRSGERCRTPASVGCSVENGTSLHGEGETHGVNRKAARVPGTGDNDAQFPKSGVHVTISREASLDLNRAYEGFVVGHGSEMGTGPIQKSRKRPRHARSPSMVEDSELRPSSKQGPGANSFLNMINEVNKVDRPNPLTGQVNTQDQILEDVQLGDTREVLGSDNPGEKDPNREVIEAEGIPIGGNQDGGLEERQVGDDPIINDNATSLGGASSSVGMEVEDTIRVGAVVGIVLNGFEDQGERKASWIRGLKTSHGIHFLGIQESKLGENSNFQLSRLWGRSVFASEQVCSEGRSGGLVSMWNPTVFRHSQVVKNRYYLIVTGTLIATSEVINVTNVYAPNDAVVRRSLWAELAHLKESMQGMWVMLGDFNDVRCPEERMNSEFISVNAGFFNDFIRMADLHEYNLGGHQFTYISDNGEKLSKLDRVLVCREFIAKWPNASVTALSRYVSDHCPIVLSIVATDFGHVPFRFFNTWLEIPGFLDYVAGLCSTFSFNGPADLAMATKLKYLKKRIKVWVTDERRKLEGVYGEKRAEIDRLEMVAESRSLRPFELNIRNECKAFVLDYDRNKHMDAQQKARVRWAIEGDENSGFFHGIINANTVNNRINGIMVDGVWVTNPTLIKDKAYAFFADKFREPLAVRPTFCCPNMAKISELEADFLIRPFTLTEIKEAVWSCDGDRAPGPDGFNFKFLKRCWNGVQNDFLALFEDFYHRAVLGPGCTSSFIALIPKSNDPMGFRDFRPISLVGCVNKVISKVLVSRLKNVVGKLVSPEQTTFLAGRCITDGPLVLNELLGWMKKAKKKGMFFKVDIDKAYDSLNWGFLDRVLEQMNFPSLWRKWVMAVVTSARASVLINGSPTHEFICHRGLKQGDPLSPFLFVLAMEALTGCMKRACSVGLFHGLGCGNRGPVLSHLMYADDVVFLGDWSISNAKNLKRLLRCFYLVSGLRINLTKCSVFGIGVGGQEVQVMADVMNCKAGVFPFNHLGLKVGANMNLCKYWKPVLDVFQSRLSIWKARQLSFGGRVTLIKSVLNSLPTHYFSLYRAPVRVIEALDRMRRVFFWGGSDEKARLNWVAWQKVCASTEYGGLGFGSLRDANLSMLSKWWWRFKLDNGCLWRRVVWSIHHNARGWNPIPIKLSISGPWKQIASSVQEVKRAGVDVSNAIRGVVGRGSDIFFWLDCWVAEEPLATRFPALFALERNKFAAVSERVDPGGAGWKWDWKRCVGAGVERAELQQLDNMIMPPMLSDVKDRWIWALDGLGKFTVASLKKLLQDNRFEPAPYVIKRNNWVPRKVDILAWRAELDRIPTRCALIRRNINVTSNLCPLCSEYPETVEHLFISCEFAQMVWNVVSQWCKLSPVFAFGMRDILDGHSYVSGSPKLKKAFHAVCLTTLWCIWKSRNELVFQQKHSSL